jgi:3'-5' exoribonuclease
VIGLKILADKIREVPDFPPRLRTLVEHLVISHHGELEFGSPKVPSFPEALLLHHLDNLDSKMEAMRSTLRKPSPIESEFTGWVPSLERVLLRKEQFLRGTAAAEPPAAPEPARETEPEQQPLPGEVSQPPLSGSPAPMPPPKTPPIAHQPPGLPDDSLPNRTAAPPRDKADRRPSAPTLFGEKLQAVLGPRK